WRHGETRRTHRRGSVPGTPRLVRFLSPCRRPYQDGADRHQRRRSLPRAARLMAGFSSPRILRLIDCRDPQLVGGKAAGIGQLLRANFRVPDGCCLTTVCYEHALYTAGGNPAAMAVSNELMGTVRSALAAVDLHEDWDARWAVRSS